MSGFAGVIDADPNSLFEVQAKLGEGSYGAVYKAIDVRDGSVVAIKILAIDAGENYANLQKEIAILRNCNSEHIVAYRGSYVDEGNLWIVMEYCSAGSVMDLMTITDKNTLEEDYIAVIMKMALQGLDYLHKARKIHRDIKSGNLLLTHAGDCKLADFGVSAELTATMAKRKTQIGTPYWMAPEVLSALEYDGKADIWSLGITAIEIATGAPPHEDLHPMKAIFVIPSSPPPTLPKTGKWSDEFHEFLKLCLVKAPGQRPSAQDLLETCAFIKNCKSKAIIADLVERSMEEINKFREAETQADIEGDDGTLTRPLNTMTSQDSSDEDIEFEGGGTMVTGTQRVNKQPTARQSVVPHPPNAVLAARASAIVNGKSGSESTPEPSSALPSIGDTLRVNTNAGERIGIVKFVGKTSFAKDDWIGMDLGNTTGKNDGSVQGVSYFQCPASHGIFVQPPAVLENLGKVKILQLGDKLRVKTNAGERTGVVKFIGPTKFAADEWIGLDLGENTGKNDGSVQGVSYFQCTQGHGIFVQPPAIIENLGQPVATAESAKSSESPPKLEQAMPQVGEQIRVQTNAGERTGIVRFVGKTSFAKDDWIGIDLGNSTGKNDGSVQGVSYFQCPASHGIFVQRAAILENLGKPKPKMGDMLRVKTNAGERTGVVKFIGPTKFAADEWIGLDLGENTGKNDGSVQGVSYFQCTQGHGIFLQPSAILENLGKSSAAAAPKEEKHKIEDLALKYPKPTVNTSEESKPTEVKKPFVPPGEIYRMQPPLISDGKNAASFPTTGKAGPASSSTAGKTGPASSPSSAHMGLLASTRRASINRAKNAKRDDSVQTEVKEWESQFRACADLQDRTYKGKKYPGCWVGSEMITNLLKFGAVQSREEAVARGCRLVAFGIFSHVAKEQTFKDDTLFYRFNTILSVDPYEVMRATFPDVRLLRTSSGFGMYPPVGPILNRKSSAAPLVFVPGIFGSLLYTVRAEEDTHADTKLGPPVPLLKAEACRWVNLQQGLGATSDITLPLDWADGRQSWGSEPLVATGCTLTKMNSYAPFIDWAKSKWPEGFCHPFPYDWRRDNNESVDLLIQHLEAVVMRHGRRAVVVAHGNGGLITLAAVNERPDLICGVVFCAATLGPGPAYLFDFQYGSGGNENKFFPNILHSRALSSHASYYSFLNIDNTAGIYCNQKDDSGANLDYNPRFESASGQELNLGDVEVWQTHKLGVFREPGEEEAKRAHLTNVLACAKRMRERCAPKNVAHYPPMRAVAAKNKATTTQVAIDNKGNLMKKATVMGDGKVPFGAAKPPGGIKCPMLETTLNHSAVPNDISVLQNAIKQVLTERPGSETCPY